ncbi:trimethylamine corrinoid protein 1, partial [Striga asiatica]
MASDPFRCPIATNGKGNKLMKTYQEGNRITETDSNGSATEQVFNKRTKTTNEANISQEFGDMEYAIFSHKHDNTTLTTPTMFPSSRQSTTGPTENASVFIDLGQDDPIQPIVEKRKRGRPRNIRGSTSGIP